jgi:hypothetical protein
MFDVFYFGTKPNAVAHEQPADSLEHAQRLSRTEYFWWITYLADLDHWDWLYVPKPWESTQRHAWPSQHQKDSGVYLVPKAGYSETNYHVSPIITRKPNPLNWAVGPDIVDWDTSWHPDPADPPYLHEFATQWWDEGGPVYTEPGYTSIKHHLVPKAQLRAKPDLPWWKQFTDCEFDYSWRPHPQDPPYTYVFGNQWWPAEVFPTVQYSVPGATEVKYVTHPHARLPERHCNRWHTLVDCDWDYSWQPDPGDPPYIYVFGNQWWPAEIMPTVEYHAPGATERKYVSWPRARLIDVADCWTVPEGLESFDFTWCPDPGDPPLIYQFGTQWQRTGGPVYTVPGATEVKYVSLPRAVKTSRDNNWTVPDGVDTSTFDWTWHPDATEPPYVYQFATQHQRTGGPQYTVPGATEVKYVDQIRIETTAGAAAIYEIDHMDGLAGQIPNTVRRVRYFDNYRDTLIRLAKSIGTEHEWVWVCSSICDYSGFDFSWHPEQWQATMLHVFRSNEQKFGDTFYMHVPTFAARAEKKALLEWYDVNFVDVSVPRRSMPVVEHTSDSHVDIVKTTDWSGPLALFTTNGVPVTVPTVPLWRQETKTIVPLSKGANAVIVPNIAKGSIKKQLYDYPYIDKTYTRRLSDQPLDVVFISNGEPNAETNWKMLSNVVGHQPNKLHRVDGINGRVAAYHAAAQASTTPWFFAVFAKLAINPEFNWAWQPDRMQQPKHYIFHARNPVNGLEYGHQAMIAYNRQLTLGNPGVGLDFTLDSAHEVVPIMSGTAYYSYTPWMAWRTAFREVVKLCGSPDVESQYRLRQWLDPETNGLVDNEQWSVYGAEDAVEYYKAVNGDFTELRKSYDWAWLASYAFMQRNLVPDR